MKGNCFEKNVTDPITREPSDGWEVWKNFLPEKWNEMVGQQLLYYFTVKERWNLHFSLGLHIFKPPWCSTCFSKTNRTPCFTWNFQVETAGVFVYLAFVSCTSFSHFPCDHHPSSKNSASFSSDWSVAAMVLDTKLKWFSYAFARGHTTHVGSLRSPTFRRRLQNILSSPFECTSLTNSDLEAFVTQIFTFSLEKFSWKWRVF